MNDYLQLFERPYNIKRPQQVCANLKLFAAVFLTFILW